MSLNYSEWKLNWEILTTENDMMQLDCFLRQKHSRAVLQLSLAIYGFNIN